MKRLIAIATAVLLVVATRDVPAQQAEHGVPELATGVCSACHGPQGHSISPVFPNLAGQQAGYIVLQLNAFRAHERGDPNARAYMWGMASQLSDATIKSLADYYAAQKPAPGESGDRALIAEGAKIYNQGVEANGVPACAACHGSDAQGKGAFPRLGGQHAEYLIAQLEGFQSGTRANAPIMDNVAHSMTHEQIRAAAAYAASR
ncbi:MAG: cytochrome c4 [Proteobacteria bacterium]|jgi:cytochrome c553|nr:cytochrome c4 [Pseudomonadota bacterium]